MRCSSLLTPHIFVNIIGNVRSFFFMAFPAPTFAACKRRFYLTKIVRIPRRVYSKRQINLSFTIHRLSHNHLHNCRNNNRRAQHNPVISEHFKIVLLNIPHQELNRHDGYHERNSASQHQQSKLLPGKMESKLYQL